MHCESTSENTHNGVSNRGERERGDAPATSVAIKSRSMARGLAWILAKLAAAAKINGLSLSLSLFLPPR